MWFVLLRGESRSASASLPVGQNWYSMAIGSCNQYFQTKFDEIDLNISINPQREFLSPAGKSVAQREKGIDSESA